jgi:hypothetical protein
VKTSEKTSNRNILETSAKNVKQRQNSKSCTFKKKTGFQRSISEGIKKQKQTLADSRWLTHAIQADTSKEEEG